MEGYKTKKNRISARRYGDVKKEALRVYGRLEKMTKRKVYVRSAYFKKQKVFLEYFWQHVFQKNPKDRTRRLQFFPAALDLIRHSAYEPETMDHPSQRDALLHKFAGSTKDGALFFVQIKEEKRTGKKYFISCFPV